jgi:alanine racemase
MLAAGLVWSSRIAANLMSEALTGPMLEIDLGALLANWRLASAAFTGRAVTAVVKSDAYGLGLATVAEILAGAGCRGFWVVSLEEAMVVRACAPTAEVYTLHGLSGHPAQAFAAAGVQPVIATLDDLTALAALAGQPARCAVQVDTGLNRLGLGEKELALAQERGLFERVSVTLWVSHLARFDNLDQPSNALQRQRLRDWTTGLPPAPLSLAASSASFATPDWHLDIGRVGSALYGVPTARGQTPPLAPVASLVGPILRVANIPAGRHVGYRELFVTRRPSRIATVALGYATGVPQIAGNRARVSIAGRLAPVVGGVSMNLLSVDVTDLPEQEVTPGARVEFFGAHLRVEDVAAGLDLSPNALLTQAGAALPRHYRSTSSSQPDDLAETPTVVWSANSHRSFKKPDHVVAGGGAISSPPP